MTKTTNKNISKGLSLLTQLTLIYIKLQYKYSHILTVMYCLIKIQLNTVDVDASVLLILLQQEITLIHLTVIHCCVHHGSAIIKIPLNYR